MITLAELFQKVKEEGDKFSSYWIPLTINGKEFDIEFEDICASEPCTIESINVKLTIKD